jgi:hypothetical protein
MTWNIGGMMTAVVKKGNWRKEPFPVKAVHH